MWKSISLMSVNVTSVNIKRTAASGWLRNNTLVCVRVTTGWYSTEILFTTVDFLLLLLLFKRSNWIWWNGERWNNEWPLQSTAHEREDDLAVFVSCFPFVLPPLIQIKWHWAVLHENVILLLKHQCMLWLIQDVISIHVIRVVWVIDLESVSNVASIRPVF